MNVSIWRLADDREEYGPCASWYILVTPDCEDDVMSLPLEHEHEALAYATLQGWTVVPLERPRYVIQSDPYEAMRQPARIFRDDE